jgi:hypothetical protein
MESVLVNLVDFTERDGCHQHASQANRSIDRIVPHDTRDIVKHKTPSNEDDHDRRVGLRQPQSPRLRHRPHDPLITGTQRDLGRVHDSLHLPRIDRDGEPDSTIGELADPHRKWLGRSIHSERGQRHLLVAGNTCRVAHGVTVASRLMAVNQMKNRMQALGLLDRAFKAAPDADLATAIESLGDDHREGLGSFVESVTPEGVRAGVKAGRIDGGMEAIAAIITDAALADCIEQLGENADNPSTDQLREVLPGLIERHNVGICQIMLAGTVAGEAPASAIIRDLLKNDDVLALPKAEEVAIAPLLDTSKRSTDEQDELRAKRKAVKKAKQEDARTRKAQSVASRRK